MTKNPLCARTDTSATDALDLMVRKGFRHLPVMDENQDISGILDITKCFYDAMEKLERAYSSSMKLYTALEGVQSELGTSQPQQIIQYVEALRSKMSGPTLETVLNGMPPTTVSVRTSVKEAAARLAKADGVSLNQWIASAVAQKIGVVETAREFLDQRAVGVNGDGLIDLLNSVRDVPPVDGDELPLK